MAKRDTTSKKGPHRVTTACKPERIQKVNDDELLSELDAFGRKLHGAIQDARSKMTDKEAAAADKETKAILGRASAAVKSSRHSA
jgi:hypothetical protein